MEWYEILKLAGFLLWPAALIWIYSLLKKDRNKSIK